MSERASSRPIESHWCGQTQPHDAHVWQTPPIYGSVTFISTRQCGGYVTPPAATPDPQPAPGPD